MELWTSVFGFDPAVIFFDLGCGLVQKVAFITLRQLSPKRIATGTLDKDGLLPLQEGAEIALHGHQSEAFVALEEL
ncbi:MAG: hypothetical protein JOY62_08415 [Acidobacteriaceae bacterium]|nr:hypothetical protein [Acidobacteriaceae bacterium]MBV9779984.1 hypothetical protein [Acidobacteriaceae bacterium]